MKKRYRIIGLIAVCIIFLSVPAGIIYWKYPKYDKNKEWVREYIIGQTGIKGTVDITRIGNDSAYEIGANKQGYAVFKNPNKAFAKMKIDLSQGIAAIQKEYSLLPLSRWNYDIYGVYGWQLTKTTDAEVIAQAWKVTSFMDIYDNSFDEYN